MYCHLIIRFDIINAYIRKLQFKKNDYNKNKYSNMQH